MGDLETCLALLFKRKGKNILSEREFVFAASMDFRWFSPKEAQVLLEMGVKRGLLERTDGMVKPSFDYRTIEIPVNYRPCKDLLKEVEPDVSLFSLMLDDMARASGQKKRDLVAKVNRLQDRLGVDIEVAALALAKDMGLDVAPYVERVRKEILAR
ncbi:MAG: DUF2240 family protein [Methanomassiliicoccales archaeon]|nr:DUF2240 family protein [Methanomassiliicoccales archaeon]MDD1755434.1 DUF2240 family protein [Methanomassiliicoccales archaeon]